MGRTATATKTETINATTTKGSGRYVRTEEMKAAMKAAWTDERRAAFSAKRKAYWENVRNGLVPAPKHIGRYVRTEETKAASKAAWTDERKEKQSKVMKAHWAAPDKATKHHQAIAEGHIKAARVKGEIALEQAKRIGLAEGLAQLAAVQAQLTAMQKVVSEITSALA